MVAALPAKAVAAILEGAAVAIPAAVGVDIMAEAEEAVPTKSSPHQSKGLSAGSVTQDSLLPARAFF